ncbi:MAG: hypothetical protein AB7S75_18675 [Desulfococcaceae bacterium]
MLSDFLLTLIGLVTQLWIDGRNTLFAACISGIVLGLLAWWVAHLVALNVNRQFSFRVQHHFYCGVAALATLLFTILFFALRYTGYVAEGMVTVWEASIRLDEEWSRSTFKKAYDAVYELHDASGNQLEDFTDKPHPKNGDGGLIPTSHEASRLAAAETYAKNAVKNFREQYPFLSKILWAKSGTAQKGIVEDMKRVFSENPGGTYQAEDAIRIAGEKIRRGLKEQVPRVVIISRIILVLAFILVQAIAFGLLIRAALADIRENFPSQRNY